MEEPDNRTEMDTRNRLLMFGGILAAAVLITLLVLYVRGKDAGTSDAGSPPAVTADEATTDSATGSTSGNTNNQSSDDNENKSVDQSTVDSGAGGNKIAGKIETGDVKAPLNATDDPITVRIVRGPAKPAAGAEDINSIKDAKRRASAAAADAGFGGHNYAGDTAIAPGESLITSVVEAGKIADDAVTARVNPDLQAPALKLELAGIKTFRYTWADIRGETEYRLLEKTHDSARFTRIATLAANAVSHEKEVFLPHRVNAHYILQACNKDGCANSAAVRVNGTLADAVGYLKASNTDSEDRFGQSVAISGDGKTLAVGAQWEDSAATGINGDQKNGAAPASGAVYIYTRSGGNWIQQAYVKPLDTGPGEGFGYSVALSDNGNTLAVGAGHSDSEMISGNRNRTDTPGSAGGSVYVFNRNAGNWKQQAHLKVSATGLLAGSGANGSFGAAVALSGDGNTLAVGADGEDSNTTGINNERNDGLAGNSGAVYVYVRSGGNWSRQAYVKASNTEAGDHFGRSVSLSNDGNILAVGAIGEDSGATGVNGNQHDNSAISSGAVYVYRRSGGNWAQQAYIKASNTQPGDLLMADEFGYAVALSGDGATLAVGARFEDSTATGVNGNQHARSKHSSGAAYVYTRKRGGWAQQAYIKAPNTGWGDEFGASVALSGNGNTLAVGARFEDSAAIGLNGDPGNDMLKSPGAAYVYTRSGNNWVHRAYVKASNTRHAVRHPEDAFGSALALSEGGDTLAVGAPEEDSGATGVNGDQTNVLADASGAVYLY
jgi:hypothetical protein